eukprot:244847_1
MSCHYFEQHGGYTVKHFNQIPWSFRVDCEYFINAAMESETSMVHDPNMKCLSVFRGKIWCKKYYSKHRKGFEDSMWNRRIKPVKCTPRTCCSECSTSEGVSSEFIIG